MKIKVPAYRETSSTLLLVVTVLLVQMIFHCSVHAQQRVYWSDTIQKKIFRKAQVGGSVETIAELAPLDQSVSQLKIDDIDSKLYWLDPVHNGISRSNLDGSVKEALITDIAGLQGFDIDLLNRKLYWSNEDGIVRAELDGTDQLQVYTFVSLTYFSVAADPMRDKLFWTDSDLGTMYLRKGPPGDLGSNALVHSANAIENLVVNQFNGSVFFSNSPNGLIQTIPNDGGAPINVVSRQGPGADFGGIAISFPETSLYFADNQLGSIRQSNINGSAEVEFIPASNCQGLALDCGRFAPDSDGDGVASCRDQCPDDPLKTLSGSCGCGVSETDDDGDGLANCIDLCPTDSSKTSPGACGCGNAETDTDLDGTPDCIDQCGNDPGKSGPGVCGCGVPDSDIDGDSVVNCLEQCPQDQLKISSGVCGCGVADIDTDGDSVLDCLDGCPSDVRKTQEGACGCGKLEEFNSKGLITCVAYRTLNPTTVIDAPPIVIVEENIVKLIFEKFGSASLKKIKKRTGQLSFVFEAEEARNKRSKITVRYEVNISRTDISKKSAIKATSKKNEYTFKNLAPGSYSAKYRATIIKEGDVSSKTNFSPPAFFKVQ